MRSIALAVGLLVTTTAAGAAQAVYPDVEYVRGAEGLPDKIKGQLSVTDSMIVFATKKGQEVLSISLHDVKEVSNATQLDPGSVGRKLLLGIFAARHEEYLFVNTETVDRAEVVVFKTKKNVSPELMAKIRHAMKVATQAVPAPPDSTTRDSAATS